MSALKDIQNGELRKALGNYCLSKATLAIQTGGSAAVKTTGAFITCIDGVLNTTAALSSQSIAVTHDCFGLAVGGNNLSAYVQPAGKTAYLLLCVNLADTIAVVQGNYSGQSLTYTNDKSKILTGTGEIPREPDGYTAFGLIKVVTANAATFTPGTTALDATDVTATYYDIVAVPSVAP